MQHLQEQKVKIDARLEVARENARKAKGNAKHKADETVEKLAQNYLFREQLGKIKDRDAASKLSDYRDRLPDQMKNIEESLRSFDGPIDTLPSEVQDLAKSRNKYFQEYVHDRIKRQMELLLPAIADLKTLLTPSNLEGDFSRQDLESMLR